MFYDILFAFSKSFITFIENQILVGNPKDRFSNDAHLNLSSGFFRESSNAIFCIYGSHPKSREKKYDGALEIRGS